MSDRLHQQDLESLLSQLFDGALAAPDRARLDQLLAADEGARQTYLDLVEVHTFLRKQLAPADGIRPAREHAAKVELPKRHARFMRRPQTLSAAVAAVVVGLLLTAMYFIVPPVYRAITRTPSESPAYEFVAQLTGDHEAEWVGGQIGAVRGAYLVMGHRMQLKKGLAEVTFSSGAKVVIEGPAELQINDHNRCTLAAGKIVGRIPPQAKGFTVATPRCEVIDLGTEFGVQVAGGETEVYVLQGLVELDAQGNRQRLALGQTAFVDWRGIHRRELTATKFRRELPAPAKIAWGAPQDFRNAANLLRGGQLVAAVNCGQAVTVGEIKFASKNPCGTIYTGGLNGRTSGNASLDALLDSFSVGGGQDLVLPIGGLTPGKRYAVQILYCDGRPKTANRPMLLSNGLADEHSVALVNQPITTDAPPFGQYAVGEFVATTRMQPIYLSTRKAGHIHVNAYLVRQIDSAIAEPQSRLP